MEPKTAFIFLFTLFEKAGMISCLALMEAASRAIFAWIQRRAGTVLIKMPNVLL